MPAKLPTPPVEKPSEFYPRWIENPKPTREDGKDKRIIVKDHYHHSQVTGIAMNPDATPVAGSDDWAEEGEKPESEPDPIHAGQKRANAKR